MFGEWAGPNHRTMMALGKRLHHALIMRQLQEDYEYDGYGRG